MMIGLVLLLGVVQGAEWYTSREQHCITKCTTDGHDYYWCPTVDGINKNFNHRSGGASGRPNYGGDSELEKTPWDYCTPTKVEGIVPSDDEEPVHAVTLPEREGSHGGGGQGGHFPSGTVDSSLPGHPCTSECRQSGNMGHMCDLREGSGVEGDRFYCSTEVELMREQLTSREKLWCTGHCLRGDGEVHRCNTLFGKDDCSPSMGLSSTGKTCLTACAIDDTRQGHSGHYMCPVDDAGNMETCGHFSFDSSKKKAVEFTADHQVCASPCMETAGEHLCHYVEWEWDEGDESSRTSTLVLKENYCGGDTGTNWAMIGGIIGGVVAAILLIAIIAVVLVKKPYERAATHE